MLGAIADCLIFLAYISIPLQIMSLVFSSGVANEVLASPSKVMILSVTTLFTLFTVLCGITHLLTALRAFEALPSERTLMLMKVITAIISIITAIVMYTIFPIFLDTMRLVEVIRKGKLQGMSRLMTLVTGNCTDVIATHSVDPQVRFLSVNGAAAIAFKRSPEALLGTSFYSIVSDEDVAHVREVLESVMRQALQTSVLTDLPAITMEYRVKSEPPGWMESSVTIGYEDMQPMLIIITRDMTSRKSLEEQRRRDEDAARTEILLNAKLQFIACCAHDLKT